MLLHNRHITIFAIIVFFFQFSGYSLHAQKRVSVNVHEQNLNVLLNEIAGKYNVKFAFDNDLLAQINASLNLKNVKLDEFLDVVCDRYGLKYREIAGTYVFYVDDEEKIADAIEQTIVREKKHVEKKKIPPRKNQTYNITVSGTVENLRTTEKLRYCKLVFDESVEAITNEMGYFQLSFESKGEVKLEIRHLGFYSFDTTLVMRDSIELTIGLAPIPQLQRMRSRKIDNLKFLIEIPDMLAYSPQNTYQLPGTEANDLVNALTVIPGINYLKGTDAGLSIRGGAPSDNLVLIDGIPIVESSHLMGNLSMLNGKFMQQAFVSRGGFGAEYGGRTSGIVDLTGKAGSNEKTIVDFTANMLHVNVYVGVPVTPKSSLSASFRKSFVDVWSNYHLQNFALENQTIFVNNTSTADADVSDTEINYSDSNIKFSVRPSSLSELNFNLFDSFDRQFRLYSFPVDDNYYQQNYSRSRATGYSMNVKLQTPKGWLNTISLGTNRMVSESESENGKDAVRSDWPVKNYYDSDNVELRETRMVWNSELKKQYLSQKFGAGYNSHILNYKYENHEIKVSGANNYNDSISDNTSAEVVFMYYQADLMPLKWIKLRAGIRGMYSAQKQIFSSQPRYGIEIIPFRTFRVKYSAGRYMQPMYLTYRVDSYKNMSPMWFIPSSDYSNLDAFHHIVGAVFEYQKVLVNVEGYQKRNMNKISFFGEKIMRGVLPVVEYKQMAGQELNRGIDVLFHWRGNHFKHLFSYSLSESNERIEGVNNFEYFRSFDHQLHRLRLTEVISWNNWTLSANWQYASGMPYLKPESTNASLQFGQLPHFFQMDVSLVKQFDFKYFYADLGFTVLNVLNRRNELQKTNFVIPEGPTTNQVQITKTSTSFSPLFYVNLRYE